MSKFLKAIFYRKGRLFPPYLFMAFLLLGALIMFAFRLIPYMQKELQLSDVLVLGVLALPPTWITIWRNKKGNEQQQSNWNGEEKRGQ